MNKSYNDYLKDFYNSIKIKSKECYYICEEEPEKIAFFGNAVFFVPAYLAYDIKSYKSTVLINPTYRDIFDLCDDYIIKSGNIETIFFKDIELFENYEEYEEQQEPKNNNDKIYYFELMLIGMSEAFEEYKYKNNIELN